MTEQAHARDEALASFAADCDARPECAVRLGGDTLAAFDRAVEQTANAALVDPESGERLNESVLAWLFTLLLPGLPENHDALESFIAASPLGAPSLSSWAQQIQSEAERSVATHCLDLGFPDANETFAQLLPELRATAPRADSRGRRLGA